MPVVDLSDEDAALLAAAKKIGGVNDLDLASRARALHDRLYTHADTAASYRASIEKVVPGFKDPAAAAAAPYVAKLDELSKWKDEFLANQSKEREEAAKAAAQSDFDGAWNGVVKSYSLTDEGQEKLGKFMQDRKLADPEAAAALYYKQNPEPPAAVTPDSIAPASWGIGPLPGEDPASSKLLMERPEAWADQEAATALTEFRRAAA